MRHMLFDPRFTRSRLFVLILMVILAMILAPFAFSTFGGQEHDPYESIEEKNIWLNMDSDRDGLSDAAEEWATTDPHAVDTDGDGISDGVEYQYWKGREQESADFSPTGDIDDDGLYNINDADSDGDGIKDGWEIQNDFDPAKRDTDGDGVIDILELKPMVGDHDNSGLPDEWERIHGVSDPEGDPDGDGISNLLEYIIGQDPHKPGSGMIDGGRDRVSSLDNARPVAIGNEIFRTHSTGTPRYWRWKTYNLYSSGHWRSHNTRQLEDEEGTEGFTVGGLESYDLEFFGLCEDNIPSPLYPSNVENINGGGNDENYTYYISNTFEIGLSNAVGDCTLSVQMPDYDIENINASSAPAVGSDWYYGNPSYYSHDSSGVLNGIGFQPPSDELTTFDGITSILHYLSTNYTYSERSSASLPGFLQDKEAGNSYHFASSFVLLARSMDIPARLSVGFAVGIMKGNYRVFSLDNFHTWAEVYLEDLGWVSIECTVSEDAILSTRSASVDGEDPWVVQPRLSDGELVMELGGSGGTAFERAYANYEELVNLENLDSDVDGVMNSLDDDDDNDGLSDIRELEIGSIPVNPDTDDDGLSDGAEVYIHGTDVLVKDTDGDGLTDGAEVDVYGTDPLREDTDNGGVGDGIEVLLGTNPRDSSDDPWARDSDDDGLSDGYEMKVGSDPLRTDTDGGGLSDFLEMKFGQDPLDPDDDPYYLDCDSDGLSDGFEKDIGSNPRKMDTDGGGADDGTEYEGKGNLTNPGDDDDFLDSDGDGLSNAYEDALGTDKYHLDSDLGGLPDGYEVRNGLDPLSEEDDWALDTDGDGVYDIKELLEHTDPGRPDTDDDGLSDFDEIYVHGTDPTDPDTDNDGLTDSEEILLGTDPRKMDSDGDGASDGLEVAYLTDPLVTDTDGDGLSDGEEFGNSNHWSTETLSTFENWISDPTLADSDGDGLTDRFELENGYDMLCPDSDGDGYSDLWEVNEQWDPSKIDITDIGPGSGEDKLDSSDEFFTHFEDFFEKDIHPAENVEKPDAPDPSSPADPPTPSGYSTPDPGSASLGGIGSETLILLIGLFIVVVVVTYWFYLKRKYKSELKEVFRKAIEDLDSKQGNVKGIREAIIRTYGNTLSILEKYNFLKKESHTPREFARAMEEALSENCRHLNDLTDVFEEARYSDHRMREKHRRKALNCFKELYGQLEKGDAALS